MTRGFFVITSTTFIQLYPAMANFLSSSNIFDLPVFSHAVYQHGLCQGPVIDCRTNSSNYPTCAVVMSRTCEFYRCFPRRCENILPLNTTVRALSLRMRGMFIAQRLI